MKIITKITLLLFITFNVFSQTFDLDKSFGKDGFVKISDYAQMREIKSVINNSDGGYFAIGTGEEENLFLSIAKLDSLGKPDPTYGEGGYLNKKYADYDYKFDHLVVKDNGQILISGILTKSDFSDYKLSIVQLLNDGSFDKTFDVDGEFIQDLGQKNPSHVNSLPLEDQSIVVAYSYYFDFHYIGTLIKLTANGDLVPNFGSSGVKELSFTNSFNLYSGTVQQNSNKFNLIYFGDAPGISSTVIITRLDADGEVDKTFGVEGFAKLEDDNLSIINPKLVFTTDDNFVISYLSSQINFPDPKSFTVRKFHNNGKVFNSFGTNGKVSLIPPGTIPIKGSLYGFVQLIDGNFIGYLRSEDNHIFSLTEDGTLNADFGNEGFISFIDPGANDAFIDIILEEKKNKLLIYGSDISNSVIIGRYNFSTETSHVFHNLSSLEISVFPNPATDYIQIGKFSDKISREITLTDMKGNVVKQISYSDRNNYFIGDLSSGSYLLHDSTGNKIKIGKFIKL